MRTSYWAAIAVAPFFVAVAAGQVFSALEAPSGADGAPTVDGVSADGQVLFGRSLSQCDPTPIRWLRSGAVVTPDSLAFNNGLPRASSSDGVHLAGDTNCEANPNALTWRWNPTDGMVPLSVLPIESFRFTLVRSLSGDGSIVAGYGQPDFTSEPEVAVRIGAGAVFSLGTVQTPTDGPFVSADGSTIVFIGRPGANPSSRVLYRWTVPAGPLVPAATVPLTSDLLAVSADGSTAYFQTQYSGSLQRHRVGEGVTTVSTACCPGLATDITPDGRVVVGLATRSGQSAAYMWDATNGVRFIDTLLTNLGVNLAGATLSSAKAISDDGTTIVGEGTPKPWMADLDEPPPQPCDPDMNQDGNADQDDVAYLINVVGGGGNPTGIDPDFNQDGNADQDDVAALINTVGGGGCP
jgi:uncharacterized membrane protein